MPRLSAIYALILVVGSLASAVAEHDHSAPGPIVAAFGVTLGERFARDAAWLKANCERRPAPALHRCTIAPPAREADIDAVVVLIDDEQLVLAIEAQSKPFVPDECERSRRQMLARFERLHGKAVEVSFDEWGFVGAVWEQDMAHAYPVRGLSLSTCSAQPGETEAHRFGVAYGAAKPDPLSELALTVDERRL